MFDHIARGFQIVPEALGRAESAAIAAALEGMTLARSRAGARHLLGVPVVRAAAEDSRMLDIARRFLGADAVPFRATLFDKSPRGNWLIVWHQDTALPLRARRDVAGWGPWSVKQGVLYAHATAEALSRVVALRLHLDDSRLDNGPLRVLPGTHSHGLLTDADIARLARQAVAFDCLAPAGGVVAMRPLLLHSSSKAESTHPRRVLHIEYADSLIVGNGLELAIA